MPVVMPHPSRQTFSSGAFLLILATAISGKTVYSLKVDVPVAGPVIVENSFTTVVVGPGATVSRRPSGSLAIVPGGQD